MKLRLLILESALFGLSLLAEGAVGGSSEEKGLRERFLAEAPGRWADYLEQAKLLQGSEVRQFWLTYTDKATGRLNEFADKTFDNLANEWERHVISFYRGEN